MVDITEINTEWAKDAEDFKENADPIRHSQEQYKLHQKYHDWYNQCCFKHIRLTGDLGRLKREKTEYYNGEMSLEDIKEKGWPIKPKVIAKGEISKYIMLDDDITLVS